jgi:hypothetical protein
MSTPFARLYQLRTASDVPLGIVTAPNMTLNAPGEKIAAKFIASRTEAITHADMYVTPVSAGGLLFNLAVYDDNGDKPGNLLGAATSNYAIGGTGWVGPQQLNTNTGILTLNASYWLVLSCGSGTPGPSNYATVSCSDPAARFQYAGKLRHFDGTNWTNTTPYVADPLIMLQQVGGLQRRSSDHRQRGFHQRRRGDRQCQSPRIADAVRQPGAIAGGLLRRHEDQFPE